MEGKYIHTEAENSWKDFGNFIGICDPKGATYRKTKKITSKKLFLIS